MAGAGWFLVHEGRKLFAATIGEARKLAQMVADTTGKPVTVRPMSPAKSTRSTAAKPKAKAKGRRISVKANPFDFAGGGGDPRLWQAIERAAAARRDYLKATKPRRIGLSTKRRGGSPAREAGAHKTAKFVVEARNRKEALTLYRPSRSQANALAAQFEAAGYTVKVREA